jgi:5-methylcytosine-specific restriction endonuclease McrBC GTP-binding regulatory subunit McrB
VEGTGLRYEVRPGLFKEFCARADSEPGANFVYIIDELNRADVGSVLGELMLLLEYRGRRVRLPYSQEQFHVPPNVLLLATMNTADRSLSLIDFAMRRRFHALPLPPSASVLETYFAGRSDDTDLALAMFKLIQERVADEGVAPGHSYWMVDDLTVAGLERIWRYELRPYLAEYWYESPTQLTQLDDAVATLLSEEN